MQSQAFELNSSLTSIRQNGDTFIANKTKEFKEIVKGIHSAQTQSNKNLERINELLEDIENKNKKYNWSIETMENQMKQLEVLTSMLKVILENNGKEESHE